MDDLFRLSKIINASVTKQNPIFDFTIDIREGNVGLEYKLFKSILAEDFANDNEAAKAFYGTDQPDHRYRMLKSRLKQKLLNHLFFMDLREPFSSLANQFEGDCINLLSQAKRLLTLGELPLAEKLLNKSLKMSLEAEFTELTILAYKMLRSIYSIELKNSSLEKVISELNQYRELEQMEESSSDIYEELRLKLNRSSHSLRSHLEYAEEGISRLHGLWKRGRSYRLFHNYYLLNTWYLSVDGDHAKLCDFLEYVDNEIKPNSVRFDTKKFQIQKVKAYYAKGQYAEAIKFAQLYVKSFDKFSEYWFEIQRYLFLSANFLNKLELSRELLNKVFINQYFVNLSLWEQQLWKLYREYLAIVTDEYTDDKITELKEESNEGVMLSFYILRYLNAVKEEDQLNMKEQLVNIEGLKQKYFKTHFGNRTKTFVKLIMKSTELTLEKEVDEELGVKTKYLLKKLTETEGSAGIHSDIEIFPYEILWGKIMSWSGVSA